jgi:hypothetical protein
MISEDERYLVEFELRGFTIAPSDITETTGLEPTFVREKGEEIRQRTTGKVLRIAEANRWEISSNLQKGSDVEDQFAQLLELLRPHKTYLIEIAQQGECTWEVSGHSYDVSGQVGLNLPAEVLEEVVEYSADIDIDIYWRGTTHGKTSVDEVVS